MRFIFDTYIKNILIIFLVFVSSCYSTKSAKLNPAGQDFQFVSGGIEDKVPLELWSPSKRRSNASFYYLAGEVQALSRDLTTSRHLFERAYNLDPNPFLAAKLIEARAGEDIDQSLVLAKKMTLLYPRNARIQFLYGRLLSGIGDLDGALEYLHSARKMDSQNPEIYSFIVKILQIQKKYKEAIGVAQIMVRMTTDNGDAWLQLARLHLLARQNKKAAEAARKAYQSNNLDPEKVHLYAVASELEGNYKQAAELYNEIISLDLTNDETIVKFLSLYAMISNLPDTLSRLGKIEKLVEKNVFGIHFMQAIVLWELRKFETSSEIFNKLAKVYPYSERIVFMSGLSYEKNNQVAQAITIYRTFDTNAELYMSARFRIVELFRQQGALEAAIRECKEVIASGSDRVIDFYPILVDILNSLKRYKESLLVLDEGYLRFPDHSDLLFMKAVSLEKMGSLDECFEILKVLTKIRPENAAASNYLGYLYTEKGLNLEEAEFYIKRALALKPGDGYYQDSLGWLYYQRGEYSKSLEVLLKANELAPNEAVILEHLAEAYIALGDNTKALLFLDKATRGKCEDRDRERILDKYEKFKKSISGNS